MNEMKSRIEALENELAKLKAECVKEKEDKKLFLVAESDCLFARYGNCEKNRNILMISEHGKLILYNNEVTIDDYKEWRNHGMQVDHSSVMFKGKTYSINEDMWLVNTDIFDGGIFDFENMQPMETCKDENVQRWPGCDTPIVF